MKITVMMASGDEDVWEDAADAINDEGSLVILYRIDGDKISGDWKTLDVFRDDVDGLRKRDTFQVAAQYAPGMWMKVEFE